MNVQNVDVEYIKTGFNIAPTAVQRWIGENWMADELRMYPDYRKVWLKSEFNKILPLTDKEMEKAFIVVHRQLTNIPPERLNVYFYRETCEEAVKLGIMEQRSDGSYLYNGHTVICPKEFDGEMMYGKQI